MMYVDTSITGESHTLVFLKYVKALIKVRAIPTWFESHFELGASCAFCEEKCCSQPRTSVGNVSIYLRWQQ